MTPEQRIAFFSELKYGIQTVADGYDVVLLDSPPALGMISINVLMAAGEAVRAMGTLWPSSLFAGRAPAGHWQHAVFLGGTGDPSALEQHRQLREHAGRVAFLAGRFSRGKTDLALCHRKTRHTIHHQQHILIAITKIFSKR